MLIHPLSSSNGRLEGAKPLSHHNWSFVLQKQLTTTLQPAQCCTNFVPTSCFGSALNCLATEHADAIVCILCACCTRYFRITWLTAAAEGCDKGFRTVINDGAQGCECLLSAMLNDLLNAQPLLCLHHTESAWHLCSQRRLANAFKCRLLRAWAKEMSAPLGIIV